MAVPQDFQLKTRVYNFLAGPEFKARNSTRFTPFAHVLAVLRTPVQPLRPPVQHSICF